MAKLTRAQQRAHEDACALLACDRALTKDETLQVLEGWHEGASHTNTRASAHFTPGDLAAHAALEVGGRRILDLCAGIGTLADAIVRDGTGNEVELVLVEVNPDYAAVARRILPQAEVIVGSMYDRVLMAELASRRFDTCVSNPPFGAFSRGPGDEAPRHRGGEAHYDCIDIASDLADAGVFILPQMAVPFRCSGRSSLKMLPHGANDRYDRFERETGVVLEPNLGIDTSVLGGFRDVSIVTEIAIADFAAARARRAVTGMPLFESLAA